MKKTLPAEQRKWIVEFERITGLVIHGENWTMFLMDEISWDDFMNSAIALYAKTTEENLFHLANLYHYLEKQVDETDLV